MNFMGGYKTPTVPLIQNKVKIPVNKHENQFKDSRPVKMFSNDMQATNLIKQTFSDERMDYLQSKYQTKAEKNYLSRKVNTIVFDEGRKSMGTDLDAVEGKRSSKASQDYDNSAVG